MVRAKSGLSLHEYLTPRLFDKIGIDAKNLMWMRMPDGMEVGGGGLYATTEDNLRLMKLYADGGVWEGERILSEEYVELATSAQNDSSTEAAHNPHATDNFLGYGYQIWMCAPEGVYRADGAMGQFCVVDPKRNLLISLNETAMGAHWAQKTLDVLWSFLARVEPGRQALPENPKAAQTLRSRMAKLALPAPDFSWNTGCARVVSGVTYAVEQGSFRFENSVGRFMSGSPASEGIRQFVFDFSEGNCTMEFVMDEETHVIAIATDGSRRWNILPNSGSPCTKLYASGAWREEDTFSVTARWIESCFERRVNFSFADESVTITTVDAIGGFGPGPGLGEDERAVARRLPGRVADF
jgi:hypothetical protein